MLLNIFFLNFYVRIHFNILKNLSLDNINLVIKFLISIILSIIWKDIDLHSLIIQIQINTNASVI
jgi:hypothetical protein